METTKRLTPDLVKGTAIINLKKFLDSQISPGFFEETVSSVAPGTFNTILPSSWYSGLDFLEVSKQGAKKLGWPFKKFCIEQNKFNIDTDLNGVYKFFLKVGGPQLVLKSMGQMVKTYTTTARYTMLENEKSYHKGMVETPEKFAEWNEYMFEGGMSGILKHLGKKMHSFKYLSNEKFYEEGSLWVRMTFEFSYS